MAPLILGVIIMSISVSIGLTDSAKRLIAEWRTAPQQVADAIDRGLGQFLQEAQASIQQNELTGAAGSGSGGGAPVGLRSGELRRSIKGVQQNETSGFVGTTAGTTTAYARSILGPGRTTIRPRTAKHLWIPIAANMGASMQAKYTPRALFDTFGDRVKIFKSKAGNTVVFVEDEKSESGQRPRHKRNTQSGKSKGQIKGKLYFVLRDQVVIQGTDALAKGVDRMGPRGAEILSQFIHAALPGGSSGASSGGGVS